MKTRTKIKLKPKMGKTAIPSVGIVADPARTGDLVYQWVPFMPEISELKKRLPKRFQAGLEELIENAILGSSKSTFGLYRFRRLNEKLAERLPVYSNNVLVCVSNISMNLAKWPKPRQYDPYYPSNRFSTEFIRVIKRLHERHNIPMSELESVILLTMSDKIPFLDHVRRFEKTEKVRFADNEYEIEAGDYVLESLYWDLFEQTNEDVKKKGLKVPFGPPFKSLAKSGFFKRAVSQSSEKLLAREKAIAYTNLEEKEAAYLTGKNLHLLAAAYSTIFDLLAPGKSIYYYGPTTTYASKICNLLEERWDKKVDRITKGTFSMRLRECSPRALGYLTGFIKRQVEKRMKKEW